MGKSYELRRFAVWIAVTMLVVAASGTPSFAGAGKKAVGSYLLRQDDGFMQILTLARKGTALSQNNGQFVGQDRFGDQQGAWRQAPGKRRIVVKTLDFTFDSVEDAFTGFGRSTFDIEFEKGFDTLFGTVLVEIFGPDQDPLDPDAIPTETFGPTAFTGTRISAE